MKPVSFSVIFPSSLVWSSCRCSLFISERRSGRKGSAAANLQPPQVLGARMFTCREKGLKASPWREYRPRLNKRQEAVSTHSRGVVTVKRCHLTIHPETVHASVGDGVVQFMGGPEVAFGNPDRNCG